MGIRSAKLKDKRLKVGIVGCGVIGSSIAHEIETKLSKKIKLIGLCDKDYAKVLGLATALKGKPKILPLKKLIRESELVIEAASSAISGYLTKIALSAGRDIFVMSSGGLIKKKYLFKLANKKRCHIFIPSGALAGLDAVKGAACGCINKVTLITRKPPKSLEGAPFVVKNKINLSGIKGEKLLFKGNALEAVKYFPQNINVAATLSLCGIGPEDTIVKIITSPRFNKNSHEIIIEADAGEIRARTDNVPSEENPKTSKLAILSAMATLKNIVGYGKIGT